MPNTIAINSRALKLIQEAEAIFDQDAAEAGAIGFMARGLVQATMPHSDPKTNEFERVNGNYVFTMVAPSCLGLPYGSIPRLVLSWITTEAVRKKDRTLLLGDSLSAFLRDLGYDVTGGRRGDITRLRRQMQKLFGAQITCIRQDQNGTNIKNMSIADNARLWWSPKHPDQRSLWDSTVTLGDNFFTEITSKPVPIDMRALKALKCSPLAIDVYCWLSYRLSYLKTIGPPIPWEGLALQFGCDYRRMRDFSRAFQQHLHKVFTVYPEAEPAIRISHQGVQLIPGKAGPHVSKRVR